MNRLKYSVKVELKQYSIKTFELLTTLGFTIFVKNKLKKSIAVIDDYRKTEKVTKIEILKDPLTTYECLYNGDKLPSEAIVALLEDEPNVSSYTIEKRSEPSSS